MQLARLARSGALPAGYVPQGDEAARRALPRARAAALRALTAATLRLSACWRRPTRRYTGRATGSPAPLRWLSAGVCPTPVPPLGWQAYVRAGREPHDRLQRLEPERHAHVNAWRLHPVGEARQAFRGGPCPVAVPLGAALGALTRVESPRDRRKGLGLIPSEAASGAHRRQGSIPPAGHPQTRRGLAAGAWASRYPAQVRRPLPLRLAPHPTVRQAMSWQAPVRRCPRSRRLGARGHPAPGVTGAMARELRGCMGAMAQEGPLIAEDAVGFSWHASRHTAQRGKVPRGIGRAAAPVGWTPRRREEACTGYASLA